MATKGRVLMEGLPESLLERITLRNVRMRITGYENIEHVHKLRGGTVGKDAGGVDYGSVPAALIFANAKDVELDGVRVIWPEGKGPERHLLFQEGVQGLRVDGK